MVLKKYPRAAPLPDAYEGRAEALLEALGRDEAKRERIVRQTLDQLNKLQ
jgi:hypothetical protein